MSHCREIELQLAEYAADELAPSAANLVADHLVCCRPCRAELARERALLGTLADLPLVACPDRVTTAILAAIETEPTRAPWYRLTWNRPAMTGLAAALALVILVPLGWHQYTRNPREDQVYSREEIQAARRDATAALLLATRVIDRGERQTARRLGNSLPETLTKTLKTITARGEGGQG